MGLNSTITQLSCPLLPPLDVLLSTPSSSRCTLVHSFLLSMRSCPLLPPLDALLSISPTPFFSLQPFFFIPSPTHLFHNPLLPSNNLHSCHSLPLSCIATHPTSLPMLLSTPHRFYLFPRRTLAAISPTTGVSISITYLRAFT